MSTTHEAMVELIVETLKHPEGAGSDLATGKRFGEWLEVSGNLDVHHLASDVLEAMASRVVTTWEELDALPVGSVVLAHWNDASQSNYYVMRSTEGHASSYGFAVSGGEYWFGMAKWGATLTVLYEAKS